MKTLKGWTATVAVLALALAAQAGAAGPSTVSNTYTVGGGSVPGASTAALERAVLAAAPGAEVFSIGERLDLVKQVGHPDRLAEQFGVDAWEGSHALGHTRLSTESRVDISHSQPFWAHGTPDLAVVHNGHITNYHRLRRRFRDLLREEISHTVAHADDVGDELRHLLTALRR